MSAPARPGSAGCWWCRGLLLARGCSPAAAARSKGAECRALYK